MSASKLFNDMVEKEAASLPEVCQEITRKNVLARLHSYMDIALKSKTQKLQQASKRGDTNAIWQIISSIADKACCDYFGLDGKDRKAMSGRGNLTLSSKRL